MSSGEPVLDDAVVLATFPDATTARIAASLLESRGIEARVVADDAGGLYPMLQLARGVRLLVSRDDEIRARALLSLPPEPAPGEAPAAGGRPAPHRRVARGRVLRILAIGLLAAALAAALRRLLS